MSDERKKPGWMFWTCFAVVALSLYSASVGPAVWLFVKLGAPDWMQTAIRFAYAPTAVFAFLPEPCVHAMQSYVQWWASLANG